MKAPRSRRFTVSDMPDQVRKRLSECILKMSYEQDDLALEGVLHLNLILGDFGLDLQDVASHIYGAEKRTPKFFGLWH